MRSTYPGTPAALRGPALATPTNRSTGLLGMTGLVGLLGIALGFGACAGSRSTGSPCLDKCNNRSMTSLERSTCELECKQTASAPAGPTGTQVAPAPAATMIPDQPGQPVQPQPAQPTGPKRYAGDTGPRQAPATSTAPPSTVPAPGSNISNISNTTTTGPSTAELQQQRGRCESTCDVNNPRSSDRATCRLQCAQITDRPGPLPPSSSGSPVYVNPPAGAPTQGGTQPAPVDRAAISACETNCNSDATRPTDRATCRLNCNAVGSVGPTPSTYTVLQGTPTGTNRADVIRSSGGVAGTTTPPSGVANPEKVAQCAAQAQQCSSTCDTRMQPCDRGCNEGKMSATDRATCKLTCESNIDTCRDDCRIQEGTCRGPAVKR